MNEVKDMLDENLDKVRQAEDMARDLLKPENIFLLEKRIGEINDSDWRTYCSVFRFLFRNAERNQSLKIADAFGCDHLKCSWPIKSFLLQDMKNMFGRFGMQDKVEEVQSLIDKNQPTQQLTVEVL